MIIRFDTLRDARNIWGQLITAGVVATTPHKKGPNSWVVEIAAADDAAFALLRQVVRKEHEVTAQRWRAEALEERLLIRQAELDRAFAMIVSALTPLVSDEARTLAAPTINAA
jgi:hypothetical protein